MKNQTRRVQRQSPRVGDLVTCTETGKQFQVAVDGCSFNYALDDEGNIFSDDGVDLREKKALRDRSKPFTGYLSGDGHHFTGWKGNVLGQMIESHSIRCSRRSLLHGEYMQAVRVHDVHGGVWYGRGSPGIAITLRAVKASRLQQAA